MEKVAFTLGVIIGVAVHGVIVHEPSLPSLNERKAVIECMSKVGWEAADPAATQLEQLYQSQRWCEQFLEGPLDEGSSPI